MQEYFLVALSQPRADKDDLMVMPSDDSKISEASATAKALVGVSATSYLGICLSPLPLAEVNAALMSIELHLLAKVRPAFVPAA